MKQNDFFQAATFQGKLIEKSRKVSLEKIVGIMALAERRQIILGSGIPLFNKIIRDSWCRLISSKPYFSGLLQLHYELVR
jgi:hypothetical protein